MPFDRPDLLTLISRIAADIESRFPGADARLRRAFLTAIAKTHAGAVHGLYGYLDWLAEQLMPDTAELEHMDRWASIWGITRKTATAATGNVIFTGTNGTIIPAGTMLQRSDRTEFTTDAEATIAAGTATVAVTAVTAGSAGNTAAGSTLTLITPISGVNSSVAVASGGLAAGADLETDDLLRARLLARIQQPPHGGAYFDYTTWALEIPGVTRAWVYPLYLGIGTVAVFFVLDDQEGSIIPDADMVETVQAYIDERRPVTAAITVFAPVAVDLDFTIELTPDTSIVRAAVEAELVDLLRREAEPGGAILISHIREAVSVAAGEADNMVVVPATDVPHAAGDMPIMGTITWQ